MKGTVSNTVALWVALAVFGAGLAYRASAWFRHGLASSPRSATASRLAAAARGSVGTLLSGRILAVIGGVARDVLLQRRIRKLGTARWLAHEFMFAAFLALLLMHALGTVLTARLFPAYLPTLNPFLALRDVFGLVLLVGVAIAAYRRFVLQVPRRTSRPSDSYAIAIVGLILVSGVLLEAVKIGSYARFQSMVREYATDADEAPLEAYWTREMGTVPPTLAADPALAARGREIHEQSCAGCHSRPQAAFVGYATAALLRPVSARLDALGAPRILWLIHFYSCLVALALLPFTKMFHLFATPLSLVVNAALARGKATPLNAATKQMIELDACTHCCACSAQCSMAMVSDAVGNGMVLPSEKVSALRALASGRDLGASELRTLQEGVCLCTGCDRCTVSCPSGIDLLGLWLSAKEALLARGEPEYALLSPLSLRRRLLEPEMGPAAYRGPVERPRQAIAAHFGFAGLADPSSTLAPGDDRPWSALRHSLQASTVAGCFGCKTCSTACPVVRSFEDPQKTLGLLPHQILYAARLRLWGLVLGSNMLWDCLGCYQCQEHCPQGVGVTDVMYELKNIAIAQAGAARRAETEARS